MRARHAHRLVAAAAVAAVLASACSLPRLTKGPLRLPPLPQTSVLYDDSGRVITTLHAEQNRTLVALGDVAESMRDAVIAAEDQRFYEHRGVDVKAIVRAGLADVRSGSIAQGASTITEQVVKNTITGDERTLSRKVKDALLAYQLEDRFSKDQILELYLNTVYFGEGAYGVQAAAKTYFDEPASRLTLAQSALLAGVISSPADYDPILHPNAAVARRNLVLGEMRRLGMIDAASHDAAVAERLVLRRAPAQRYPAAYFVDHVKRWFLSNTAFGRTYAERYRRLYEGGLRITTTVDLGMQRAAERAVQSILPYRSDPDAAMTVIDPRTGAIGAMVGGRNFFGADPIGQLNLATGGATGRPAGSSFKPFSLVTALDRGVSPHAVYAAPSRLDVRLPPGNVPPVWPVGNYDGEGGGRMTLEQATIDSVNTVYAQLIMQVGPAAVVDTAREMGITSPLRAVPSAVLGTNDVNTVEMASAYGTLATMGRHADPIAVTRITDARGRVLYAARPVPRQVLAPGVAWVTDQILQKVVQQGTGTAATIGRPAAGKTGTAEQWRDAWFVGFVPQLVAAVWVGFAKWPLPMVAPRVRIPQVVGGTWPAQIWHAFMVNALRRVPVQAFAKPDLRYVSVTVDARGWCLPNRFAVPSETRVLRLIDGAQPTRYCLRPTGPRNVLLPDVSGKRAEAARSLLESYGFQVALEGVQTRRAIVFAQDPPPGTSALQGTTVRLLVGPELPTPSPSPAPSASTSPPPSPSPSPSRTPS